MSKVIGLKHSLHGGDDDDHHPRHFDGDHFFFDFGHHDNHGHHDDDHGVQIAVQGNQWVLTNGHHSHAITGDSVVLHGETYLLVDQFGGGYQTIQAAVDAASCGATVLVASGTYAEQVSVVGSGKDGLTIEAADCNNVVITAPATLVKTADAANTGRDMVGLVTVDGADHVTIKDVTVDGAHRGGDVPAGDSPTLVGIAYVNSDGGVIDHVDVTGIRESDAAFGNQRGVGIYVTNDDPSPLPSTPHTPSAAEAAALNSIEIKHSTVEDFQKGGIVVSYADVDIHDNTVTGYGLANNQAQNGIQVANSTGSVEDNSISGIGYVDYSWGGSGILSFQNRDLVIDDNTITGTGSLDSVTGIYHIDSVGGHITGNTISNVLYAIDAEDYPTAWGYPDPMLPGGPHDHNFDFSSNDVSDVYAGMWFQPDAATTDVFKVTGTSADDAIFGAANNDVLNGGKGADYLSGEGGNDKLSGDKDGDTLVGGAGNDSIDGGSGVDTANFSGSYDDYTITQVGKQTNVSGPDGADQLKDVEWLQFDDARFDVAKTTVYRDDASIDVSAQDPLGDMILGTGIPADGFGIVRNEKAGVELGLKVHNRFDFPTDISHSDADGYADGELHFQVNAGAGNPPANTRAEWNFDFSIATGLNGATTDLSNFNFKLKFDVDKTAGTDYRVLVAEAEGTPQAAGQSGFQWRDQGTGFVFVNDDEGNAHVTQNSENYGFSFIQPFIDDNPSTPAIDPYHFGPGEFDIVLEAYKGSALIAANHMVVDVV